MQKMLAGAVVVLLVAGCVPPSMNKRVGFTAGGVNVAVAIALDSVKADNYTKTKIDVISVCEEIKKFLESGNVADLPVGVVQDALLQLMASRGLGAYSSIIRAMFDNLGQVSVDTEVIGANNLYLLRLGVDEAIEAAKRSRAEWRQDGVGVPGAPSAPVSSE